MTPTTEGEQLAADLANAVSVEDRHPPDQYNALNLDRLHTGKALTRLATEHLALKAQLEEALADLREIYRLAVEHCWAGHFVNLGPQREAATIAAKYRVVSDPLIEAVSAALGEYIMPGAPWENLRAELSKRGYEIGKS